MKIVDSLDEYNREAFHPFRPNAIFDRTYIDRVSWIHYYNYFPVKTVSGLFTTYWGLALFVVDAVTVATSLIRYSELGVRFASIHSLGKV